MSPWGGTRFRLFPRHRRNAQIADNPRADIQMPARRSTHTTPARVHALAGILAGDTRFQRRRLTAGTTLMPHAFAHEVLVVLEGALAIEASLADGEVHILEVVGPSAGVLVGRLLASARVPTFLRALAPTTLISLPAQELTRLLDADGKLACSLASQLCERAAELRERLVARSTRDAHLRVGHALLYLLDKVGLSCAVGPGARLTLSQAIIAAVAGVARPTANRALRDLQSLGLIHLEREATCVLDRSEMERLVQGVRLESARRPVGQCKLVRADAPLSCHPLREVSVTLVPLRLRHFVKQ